MEETVFEAKLKNGTEIIFNQLKIYTSKYGEVILAGSNPLFIHDPNDSRVQRKVRGERDTWVKNLCPFSEVESIIQRGVQY